MADECYRAYLLRLWAEHAQALPQVTLITIAQPDEWQHFDCIADGSERKTAIQRRKHQ